MERGAGEFVRVLRVRRGLSVERLALKAGIAPSTLRRWEQGTFQPNLTALDMVLRALGASERDVAHAVALIRAPRATSHLRGMAGEYPAEEWHAWMPCTGDLWRAMRLRCGLTERQVAAYMGVHPSTVTRWERSASVPPEDRRAELFALLRALPEERDALQAGSPRLAIPVGEDAASLDVLEDRLVRLIQEVEYDTCRMGDVRFLILEAQVWPAALRRPSLQQWLFLLYTWHAEWLLRQGRMAEVGRYAERALSAIPSGAMPEERWLKAAGLAAQHAAHGNGNGKPERGLTLRARWLDVAASLGSETHVYRDMADYACYCRNFPSAFSLIAQAHATAERSGDNRSAKLADFIHARILVKAGQAASAIPLLPQEEDPYPIQRVWDAIQWAETLLGAGEKSEAHDRLLHAYSLMETHGLGHLASVADLTAKRL